MFNIRTILITTNYALLFSSHYYLLTMHCHSPSIISVINCSLPFPLIFSCNLSIIFKATTTSLFLFASYRNKEKIMPRNHSPTIFHVAKYFACIPKSTVAVYKGTIFASQSSSKFPNEMVFHWTSPCRVISGLLLLFLISKYFAFVTFYKCQL